LADFISLPFYLVFGVLKRPLFFTVRRSQHLDARGKRLKIEFRMIRHALLLIYFLAFVPHVPIRISLPSLSYCCRIYLYPITHELDPISISNRRWLCLPVATLGTGVDL
jgi:hypothetical protein